MATTLVETLKVPVTNRGTPTQVRSDSTVTTVVRKSSSA